MGLFGHLGKKQKAGNKPSSSKPTTKPAKTTGKKVGKSVPDVPDGYPFERKAYEVGERRGETAWYADVAAAHNFAKDLIVLEGTLPALLPENLADGMYTDASDLLAPRAVMLLLNGPTPTGKAPRYPVVIRIDTFGTGCDGTVGEVRYTGPGVIGYADLNYWRGHRGICVSLRMTNGTLKPTKVTEVKDARMPGDPVVVWKA